jgi:hypothetical protein
MIFDTGLYHCFINKGVFFPSKNKTKVLVKLGGGKKYVI